MSSHHTKGHHMPNLLQSFALLPRLTVTLTRPAPRTNSELPSLQPQDLDPVRAAIAHKQRVRAAATRNVARLALLFLTCDDGPTPRATETELVAAAWEAAKSELGHREFVRTHPATFSDLHALAG
jgi:hypothetical protein